MGEDIKLTSVFRTRRLRPVSREDRQDDEERFSKKLAELREEAEENSRARRDHAQSAPTADETDQPPPADEDGGTGQHLDLRT